MKVTNLLLNITSENPDRLFQFYRDVIGLELEPNMGDHALQAGGGAVLAFDGHAQTSGQAKEPSRYLVDLFTEDDVRTERERLEALGVPFIRKEGVEYWGGVISTFVDPDGNYGQIIKFDPALARPEEAPEPVAAS